MQIKGQAALVTGGASGLGAGTARALAAAGAKVTLLDVQPEAGEAVAKEIGGLFVKTDVTNADDVATAVAAGKDAHGPARICVNCAGIVFGGRTVGKKGPLDLDLFKRVIDINLVGTFNVLRLAAAEMASLDPVEENERGIIINTSSVAAFDGQIGQAAYSASKAAIAGMTLPIARDLSMLGIRVNTIAPGLFATPMMASLPQDVQDSLAASSPFPKRLGTAEDYAKLAVHIVENVMLNAETIRIDAGVRLEIK